VLNERELHAHFEMNLEAYIKTINVEAQLMVLMANRYILPAAFEYLKSLGQSVAATKAGGVPSKEGKKMLTTLVKLSDQLRVQTEALARALDHHSSSTEKHAKYMRDAIVPAMAKLRETGDLIEGMVPHGAWPHADVSGDVVREVTAIAQFGYCAFRLTGSCPRHARAAKSERRRASLRSMTSSLDDETPPRSVLFLARPILSLIRPSAQHSRAGPREFLSVAIGIRLVHVLELRTSPFFEVLLGDSRGYDEWARRIAGGTG
jgi:hypothetical protein